MKTKQLMTLLLVLIILIQITCKKNEQVKPSQETVKDEVPVISKAPSLERVETLINQAKTSGSREKAKEFHNKAFTLYKAKNYEQAEINWFEAAKADPSWGRAYYNLACMTSLQEKTDIALQYVKLALEVSNGALITAIVQDTDLNYIRKNPGFIPILEKYITSIPEKTLTSIVDKILNSYAAGKPLVGITNDNKIIYFLETDRFFGDKESSDGYYNQYLRLEVMDLSTSEKAIVYSVVILANTYSKEIWEYSRIMKNYGEQLRANLLTVIPYLYIHYNFNFDREIPHYEFGEYTDALGLDINFFIDDQTYNISAEAEGQTYPICEIDQTGFIRINQAIKIPNSPYYFFILQFMTGITFGDYTEKYTLVVSKEFDADSLYFTLHEYTPGDEEEFINEAFVISRDGGPTTGSINGLNLLNTIPTVLAHDNEQAAMSIYFFINAQGSEKNEAPHIKIEFNDAKIHYITDVYTDEGGAVVVDTTSEDNETNTIIFEKVGPNEVKITGKFPGVYYCPL